MCLYNFELVTGSVRDAKALRFRCIFARIRNHPGFPLI